MHSRKVRKQNKANGDGLLPKSVRDKLNCGASPQDNGDKSAPRRTNTLHRQLAI
jgi:hypothetical protein